MADAGILFPADSAGILFPAIPAGIPFLAGPAGPVGPDGKLSPSDPAGILFPAIHAGMPFPAGAVDPVGTLSPSDSAEIIVLFSLLGRCPGLTLPECCFPLFLLGYRSQ